MKTEKMEEMGKSRTLLFCLRHHIVSAVGWLRRRVLHARIEEPEADDRREVLSGALCYMIADSAVQKQILLYDEPLQID